MGSDGMIYGEWDEVQGRRPICDLIALIQHAHSIAWQVLVILHTFFNTVLLSTGLHLISLNAWISCS